jgi:adenosyl cobinamide kinase/adenosyl cobinamide phosphate guanylyltransferase
MSLVLLTGGARSGKSALAVALAEGHDRDVVFLATAGASDDEMAARIARHRAERPSHWITVEEPLALEEAMGAVEASACLVVDCLSLWAANLLAVADAETVERAAAAAAAGAVARPGPTVAVTNEVGLGVVPASALGRAYRDVLGRVNAAWAACASESYLVVAGGVVPLQPAATVLDRER